MQFRFVLALSLLCTALACGDESDRFERIERLRGLGVRSPTPIILNPAADAGPTVVNLSFFFALPMGQRIDQVSFMTSDSGAYGSFMSGELTAEPSYREVGSLQLVEITGQVAVSSQSAAQFAAFRGVVRLRYGLQVVAGSISEAMIGEVRVVADSSDPALSWKPHTLSLTEPSATTAAAGTIDLLATLNKSQDETVKVSWFISSGQIKNSRALSSTWTEMGKGKQTVIVAIYPRKSLFFDLLTYEIDLQ